MTAMHGQLEILRWIPVHQPVLAVALTGNSQYIVAGSEQGMSIYGNDSRLLSSMPSAGAAIHQVVATTDLGQVYAGDQLGVVVRLDLHRERDTLHCAEYPLFDAPNDLHTLAVAGDGRALAIGHLSAALSVVSPDGALLWRQHPDDGTPAEGQIWSVALDDDGSRLYAGSGGLGTNMIIALDGHSSVERTRQYVRGRVTAVAALPGGQGLVASIPDDPYSGRLIAFPPSLSRPLWERNFDEPVTALAADREQARLVAAVGYAGQILLLDATDGRPIADRLPLQTIVNAVALAQGRMLAAATQDGQVALMRCMF